MVGRGQHFLQRYLGIYTQIMGSHRCLILLPSCPIVYQITRSLGGVLRHIRHRLPIYSPGGRETVIQQSPSMPTPDFVEAREGKLK